jgi:hypothetical protein
MAYSVPKVFSPEYEMYKNLWEQMLAFYCIYCAWVLEVLELFDVVASSSPKPHSR